MGLFKISGGVLSGLVGSTLGGSLDDRPHTIEKINMLFKDVELEGKKQGYAKASNEYSKAYSAIEKDFLDTKKIIEEQKSSYGKEADMLINKLDSLEKEQNSLKRQKNDKNEMLIKKLHYLRLEKDSLDKQVNMQIQEVSSRFDLSISDIKKSLSCGILLVGGPIISLNLLNIVYSHKEKKLIVARQKGYAEAKELFDHKLSKLKSKLKELKINGDRDIQELVSMINEILEAIIKKQVEIAELKILLSEETK